MSTQPTDTELLDWLERQERRPDMEMAVERDYDGWRVNNRGNLHYGYPTVRSAILAAMELKSHGPRKREE